MPVYSLYYSARSPNFLRSVTGYATTAGGFNNYLGALRSRGLLQGDLHFASAFRILGERSENPPFPRRKLERSIRVLS